VQPSLAIWFDGMARNSFALFTQTPLFPVQTCKDRHGKGHVFNVYDAVRSKCSVPFREIKFCRILHCTNICAEEELLVFASDIDM